MVAGNRGRIPHVVAVNREAVSVVAVQPSGCAEPHKSPAILQDALDVAAAHALPATDPLEFDFVGQARRTSRVLRQTGAGKNCCQYDHDDPGTQIQAGVSGMMPGSQRIDPR